MIALAPGRRRSPIMTASRRGELRDPSLSAAGRCIYYFADVYIVRMTKRLIEIDDDLLERARAAAGTPTIRATIQAGLERLAAQAVTVQHIRRMRRRSAVDRDRLAEARASRIPLK